jgi:signal peptidase I
MNDGQRLSFAEFLADMRGVVTSPRIRFQAIHARGALWGSLVLLLAPAYFAFPFLGGIYFEHDPFPGYSFLLPLVAAGVIVYVKLFAVHFIARLFEGKWHYSAATGKLRDLFVVFGYSGIPSIMALLVAFVLFATIPGQLAALFRNYRIVATSVLVALGIALFVWHLILMVLALRPVYPMRDLKLVAAVFLGPILASIPAVCMNLVAPPVHVEFAMLAPLFNERIVQFVSSDPESGGGEHNRIGIYVDVLVNRVRDPQRFELVAYMRPEKRVVMSPRGRMIITPGLLFSTGWKEQLAGRIVGLPGDEVEINNGKLRINGQVWEEPYIPSECYCEVSLPATRLGKWEYLILPEDRRLIESHRKDLVVSLDRISGRLITNKWPFGWWLFRPTAYMKPHPVS